MDSERQRLVETSGADHINKTENDRPTEYISPGRSTIVDTKRKKKFVIIGIAVLIFIVALTVTLVLVLKKKDEPVNPPTPVDPTVHYNPYQVLESDPEHMHYKIGRNTKLDFQYPYPATVNNPFVDTLILQGSRAADNSNLRVAFSSVFNEERSLNETPV